MSKKPVILIVEDNESISKLVQYKLTKDGYEVIIRENGIDGYQAVCDIQPDLVILDVMMPGMSGFEVLQKIRETEVIQHVQVMMLTSKSREEDIKRGFDLGVKEYMGKPFKVGELSMRIKKMLQS
jgi:DNA-binding response OmpR family regulator